MVDSTPVVGALLIYGLVFGMLANMLHYSHDSAEQLVSADIVVKTTFYNMQRVW